MSELIILRAQLSAIQETLTQTLSVADSVARADIGVASDTIGKSLKEVNGVIDHASEATTYQREEAARQGFSAISLLQEKIDGSSREIFAGVNTTLSSAASLLDGVPFISIPDTVFAITPYRIRKNTRDSEIDVYGYFPSLREDASAVSATVDGKAVQVHRSAGKIFFDLPPVTLQGGGATALVSIQLPKRHWYSHKITPVEAKLHLLNSFPYSFEVSISVSNPAAYETLAGSPRVDGTNNYQPVHYGVEDLFGMTVAQKARYVASTATFVNVIPSVVGIGKACGGCPDPHFIQSFTSTTVDAQLWAPSCGVSWGCGGGGSHIEVAETATFTVHVKDVPDEIPDSVQKLQAAPSSISKVQLPNTWSNALIKMHYDDNFDVRETYVVVTPKEPAKAAPLFDCRVQNGNQILLATR